MKLRLFPKHRRLPPFRPRLSFPRTDNLFGYPTAIEITWLRAHALAIDETVDATGIEGKVIGNRAVWRLRPRITPGDRFSWRYQRFQCPVLAPRLSIRKSTCRETASAVPRGHRAVECRKSAVPRFRGRDRIHASRRSAGRRVARRCADGLQPVLAAADNPTRTPVRVPGFRRKAAVYGRYIATCFLFSRSTQAPSRAATANA